VYYRGKRCDGPARGTPPRDVFPDWITRRIRLYDRIRTRTQSKRFIEFDEKTAIHKRFPRGEHAERYCSLTTVDDAPAVMSINVRSRAKTETHMQIGRFRSNA